MIHGAASGNVCTYDINVPMLHAMGNVGRLHQMLDHDCSLAIDGISLILVHEVSPERFVPPRIPEHLEVLIHDVRGQHVVDDKLTEALLLRIGCANLGTKVSVTIFHEE
jgi:hypothetical protein